MPPQRQHCTASAAPLTVEACREISARPFSRTGPRLEQVVIFSASGFRSGLGRNHREAGSFLGG